MWGSVVAWLGSSRLGRFIVQYVIANYVGPWAKRLWNSLLARLYKWRRSKAQEEAKPVYDKVMENPESNPDQKGKAYEDYHNSGR